MINLTLLIAIIFSIAIVSLFSFMVSANISQNRILMTERVNTDHDNI